MLRGQQLPVREFFTREIVVSCYFQVEIPSTHPGKGRIVVSTPVAPLQTLVIWTNRHRTPLRLKIGCVSAPILMAKWQT